MNKQKFIFNLFVFSAALCLVISFFKRDLIFSILALALALGAQFIFRKWYSRKIYSYKEVMEERKRQAEADCKS
ncbi:hypothetical protein [Oceanobacillus profundus]|uniref:hypothetical protein n=1 Tax=Oceanobacillus profundus TaxID=372463 RepID=UPI003631CFF8